MNCASPHVPAIATRMGGIGAVVAGSTPLNGSEQYHPVCIIVCRH
jgi:hypothetical protein